jgi:hypothetical protein
MAHFVLVACAMSASPHRGDGLKAHAAHATSWQRLAGAS